MPHLFSSSHSSSPTCLVSVVVPAYNAEATIDETLRSVRGQSYRALEIIVVDDGSTDKTISIANAHAAVDDRISILVQENAGVASARNAGWQSARSEFIAFVDADDLWAPTKIACQLKVMVDGDQRVGLVYTWFNVIDEAGHIRHASKTDVFAGDVLSQILKGNFVGNGSSALVRREALVAVGGFEPALRKAGAQGCEDILFYYRVASAFHFGVVPDFLTGYRVFRGNMSSDRPRMLRSWMIVADEMRRSHPNRSSLVNIGVNSYVIHLLHDALRQCEFKQFWSVLSLWRSHHPTGLLVIPSLMLQSIWTVGIRSLRRVFVSSEQKTKNLFIIGEPER
jgi:glycosyltransferase involved in cell wall biosynthesis